MNCNETVVIQERTGILLGDVINVITYIKLQATGGFCFEGVIYVVFGVALQKSTGNSVTGKHCS